jgi:hypothetical protein
MEQLKECKYLLQIKMEMAKEQWQMAKEQLQIKTMLQYMPCKLKEYLLPMAKGVSSDCRGGRRGPVEQLGGAAVWSKSAARQRGATSAAWWCGATRRRSSMEHGVVVESGVSAARVLW